MRLTAKLKKKVIKAVETSMRIEGMSFRRAVLVPKLRLVHLVPTLGVGMQSWPLQRPGFARDAGASGLTPTLERGSQSARGQA
jgi:hypothetical protein